MIDWNIVRALRDDLGPEGFEEVVTLFVTEQRAGFARLAQAADPPEQEAALHFIRCGAMNLGFHNVADLCRIGEARAAAGQKVDSDKVSAVFDISLDAFFQGRDKALG